MIVDLPDVTWLLLGTVDCNLCELNQSRIENDIADSLQVEADRYLSRRLSCTFFEIKVQLVLNGREELRPLFCQRRAYALFLGE